MVKDAIKRTKRPAGPSGMDTDGWGLILISGNFGNVAEDLRKSIAEMAKRICQERIANYLAAVLACRLILIYKQPGDRPVRVGEVLRQVIGKIAMKHLRKDVLKATRSLQLCAGQDAGSEAAIHAVYDMFNEDDAEVVLMVDASNVIQSTEKHFFTTQKYYIRL